MASATSLTDFSGLRRCVMGKHYGIQAETGQIKGERSWRDILASIVSKVVWTFKVALRFKMR